MSNYNDYAKRLDAAFKEAREIYISTYNAYTSAKAKYEKNKQYIPGEQDYTWKARRAEAELAFSKAEEAFKNAGVAALKKLNEDAATIQTEIKRALMGDGLAQPKAVDLNAVELMKAGILNADDMEHFAELYNDNYTMLRLIGKYAQDMAANIKGKDERSITDHRKLTLLANNAATGLDRKYDEFAELVDAVKIYSGQTRSGNSPDFVVSMLQKWDSTQAAIDNF